MSLARRMEIVLGGPKRPIELTVREADVIGDALEVYAEYMKKATRDAPPNDVEDMQSDSEGLARIHDLRQRFLEFAGYERRPRG